jgi:hypothetical protein
MEHREQTETFKEKVRHVAFADGADSAFEMLLEEGWTLPAGEDSVCPPGHRIFATATWERRILMRDSDGSLWALQLEE